MRESPCTGGQSLSGWKAGRLTQCAAVTGRQPSASDGAARCDGRHAEREEGGQGAGRRRSGWFRATGWFPAPSAAASASLCRLVQRESCKCSQETGCRRRVHLFVFTLTATPHSAAGTGSSWPVVSLRGLGTSVEARRKAFGRAVAPASLPPPPSLCPAPPFHSSTPSAPEHLVVHCAFTIKSCAMD